MNMRSMIAGVAALASAAALAGPIGTPPIDLVVQIDGFAQGHAAVDVSEDPWGWIGAGQFKGLLDGTSFLTYCTDLSQSFAWHQTYTYTLVANGSPNGFNTTQADLLGKLYTVAGGDAASTDASVAFQLAVWEIMNEDGTPDSVTSGSFRLIHGASATQRGLANDWLLAANATGAARGFDATRLYSSVAQDFVVFTEVPVPLARFSTPEPASLVLTGAAMLAALTARRRR